MAFPTGNIYYADGVSSADVTDGSEGNNQLTGTEPSASTLGGSIGGDQSGTFWTFTALDNDPNLTTWLAGDFIAQINMNALGADVTWGIEINRINSSGAVVENLATGSNTDHSTATVQTLTWANPSDKTVAAGDRLQIAVIGVRAASHGNQACDIDVGTGTDSTTTKLNVPAGAVVLVVQDAFHGQIADNVALTQANILVVSDTAHGQIADNVALTQANVLVVGDTFHAQTADVPTLTQHNILAVDDTFHAQTADSVVLTQHNVLSIDDTFHSQTADNVTVTHNPPGGVTLVVQGAFHGQTADSVVLTQANILVVSDTFHSQTADSPALTQHNILTVNDALHNQTADSVTLSTSLILTATANEMILLTSDITEAVLLSSPISETITNNSDITEVVLLDSQIK